MMIMALVVIFFFQAVLELVTVRNNIREISFRIKQGFMLLSIHNIILTMFVTIMFFENTKFKKATIAVMVISSTVAIHYSFTDTGSKH